MKRVIGAALLLTLAAAAPVGEASAQSGVVGGAIVGGAVGGAIGGAVGGRGGVAAGVAIGATTGALIGAEAERRRGHYWWKGNCYYRNSAGEYYRVSRAKCG